MDNATFEPKKFAIIGAGPVGCIVAAFLAKGGYEVTLCDIDKTLLEPALDPGILIEGTDSLQAKVAKVTTRIEDLQHDLPDVIVVAVKAIALPAVASALRSLFNAKGDGPYIISWQNGIDTELLLAQQLGSRRVMRGVVNLGCVPLAPAHVRIGFHIRPHHIQELDPRSRPAAMAICKVFTECGLETLHTEQIRDLVWRKAILNGCMNPICAVTGKTMAELIEDPILFHLVGALIKEGVAVARANEYALGSGFYPYCIDYIKSAGHHKPSMLQDIEAGRRTEVDFINGKIAEYGAQAEVPTPYNTMIRGLVKALEGKGKGNGLEKVAIDIRTRVESLSARMFDTPQYPSQGSVLFVDLERRKSFSKYLPKDVFRTFLSNRGGNMYLLYNLLLEGREALDPQIPLIFGAGVLQETTPTTPITARGNIASVSPDHHAILDSNCVDAFPAFLKMQGYDHLVLYGQASAWTLLELSSEAVRFHDAAPYLGMDNTDFTHVIEKDFSCSERKDMAMARITRAGENQVLCSAIMGGRSAMYARGGTGAKMGGLKLKAVMILGGKTPPALPPAPHHHHPRTPWAELLDAEHLAGYRAGLEGCQQCPIRCNNLDPIEIRKPLDQPHGPDYTPLEGLGPMVGIRDPKVVAHLGKLLNNLGLDPASTGAAIAWAMDLFEQGIITTADTGALELIRGNSETVEKLLLLTARREGFGDVIADSTQAVERGKYPEQALPYRMAMEGLFQSDPHGESILEGFALGFAEAVKENLKSAGVQDAVGLCRFATRRAAASATGLDDFAHQMQIQTEEVFTGEQLEEVGLNISGMERLINSRLGLVAKNESLLDAWIDEEIPEGPFAGERLEKAKFQALKGSVETFLGVNGSGLPSLERHRSLAAVTTAFAVKVTLPDGFPGVSEGAIILDQPLATVAELRAALKQRLPLGAKLLSDNSLIMAVGGTLVMSNEKAYPIHDGDEIAVLRVAPGV